MHASDIKGDKILRLIVISHPFHSSFSQPKEPLATKAGLGSSMSRGCEEAHQILPSIKIHFSSLESPWIEAFFKNFHRYYSCTICSINCFRRTASVQLKEPCHHQRKPRTRPHPSPWPNITNNPTNEHHWPCQDSFSALLRCPVRPQQRQRQHPSPICSFQVSSVLARVDVPALTTPWFASRCQTD